MSVSLLRVFAQMLSRSPSFANRKRIEFAVPLFRSYAAKVIGIFLDLCYGRPIAQAGFTDETTFISLLNLFVKTNSHELRRRLFDSGTEVPSRSLAESLRLASTKNDIEWGAQSIHLLTQKLQMDKLQTVEQIRWVMANCSDAWKLVLYDLLLEDRDRPARLVVLRKDWPRVVDEFEKRLKERQAAVMPKQVPPASTQPASNPAAPVKRPAGSEQPSAECRADKVRKTRSC